MKKEDLITTLKYLKEDAIRKGKESKEKCMKDFYFGETLAYNNLIVLMEA